MIIIEFENLSLNQVAESDLEQMRNWRNADHVRFNMDHQKEITIEEQKLWFENLDNKKNLYFIIKTGNHPIGVLNLKEIDWDKRVAQAGIFVGEKSHLSTMMPIIAVFVLMKVCFDCLDIIALHAKIAAHNKNALQFNKQFGYQFHEEVKEGFDNFICTKDSFYSPDSAIKKLHELFNKNGSIKIHINEDSKWIESFIHIPDHHFRLMVG